LNDLITISVQQEHNLIKERGIKMVNMVQTKQNKEHKHKFPFGKEKEKESVVERL
jgi:hypothetical protein